MGQPRKKESYALQRIGVGRDVIVVTLWSSELRGALIWCVGALESFAIYAVRSGRRALVDLLLLWTEREMAPFLRCLRRGLSRTNI